MGSGRKKYPDDTATSSNVCFYANMNESRQPFFIHVEGIVVYANRAMADCIGCTVDELIGMQVWEFIIPEEIPRVRAFAAARLQGDDAPSRYEFIGRRLDSTPLHLDVLVRIDTWDGKTAFHVFVQDRTAERNALTALKRSEQKFRSLIEGSLQGLFVQRDWKVLYANEAANSIFGYLSRGLVGVDVRDLIAPDDREFVSDFRRRRLSGDVTVPERYEMRAVKDDGREITVEMFSRVVVWDGDEAIQTAVLDVTQRKETEISLLRAKEDAERADRAKTEFLGHMSHELRTPLNAIIGFSQLIHDRIMGDKLESYLDYAASIHSSGLHLLEVVNDLLDVASIESGSLVLHEEPTDIVETIKACERMLRSRAQRAKVIVSLAMPVEPMLMLVDRRRIMQVLINLLGNAIKFTDEDGQVKVSLNVPDTGAVEIIIEDTGIGIAPHHLAKVFDPFFRVNTAFVSKQEGTGLGLPLCRDLAEMHGGSIDLQSTLGEGTITTMTLPAERRLPGEIASGDKV